MRFIEIDDKIVNMDRITYFEVAGMTTHIYFYDGRCISFLDEDHVVFKQLKKEVLPVRPLGKLESGRRTNRRPK